MAPHPHHLRSPSRSSKKPHSAPSSSIPTRRRRSVRSSSSIPSNMVDTIDWSRFGQGPRAPFAQISVPATNKEVSDLDVATQIIQHAIRGKTTISGEDYAQHATVVDEAFAAGLSRIRPEVRSAQIINPAIQALRTELRAAASEAVAAGLAEIKGEIQQVKAELRDVKGELRQIKGGLGEVKDELQAVKKSQINIGLGLRTLAQESNRRSGDGSIYPYCTVPSKDGKFPEDVGLLDIRNLQQLLDLDAATLKKYLEFHGHPSAQRHRALAKDIGVEKALLPL